MTGLILKDLMYLRRTAKVLLLLLAFYFVLFAAAGGDTAAGIFSAVTVMLTVLLSVNAFAYDEAAKWSVYERSLPVSKSGVVLARYSLGIVVSTCLTLISFLAELVILRGVSPDNLTALWVSWSVALLFCAILFPLMYKYGTQKARMVLMIVVLLPTLGMILLQKANLPLPSASAVLLLIRFLPLAAVAVVLISFQVSCRIFRNKED
ncbi:ABC-2 family transporter protein [Caprobacter fermentans]|uniref:ABC-2 family transporter protein n=1 Tax=Caproicibacter fermentans TaxID=2576756 RepID=A0A6N8HZG5_9FIRM|nr:ABC-2 transporter permease [Caproicibacter fermentans]MVB11099.1 ABC-2 family transporter protein [Caproicibacter fermentans]